MNYGSGVREAACQMAETDGRPLDIMGEDGRYNEYRLVSALDFCKNALGA